MDNIAVYERDMLYPTENMYEPGSIHIEILNPLKKVSMPVIIESKTHHSPIKYIHSIVHIMQSDIFDRIHIDIRTQVSIYIKLSDELKKDYHNKRYLRLVFDNDKVEYVETDEIE